uniref:Uncharacterized protein n=1 Tax=Rhizophora mucronata TaxID=61149 RepID=A0A2P2J2D3_RHIMU
MLQLKFVTTKLQWSNISVTPRSALLERPEI